MVEHSAVNRVVVGSSPTRGAEHSACTNTNLCNNNGAMAKWKGKGLQHLYHQFKSGWRLSKKEAFDHFQMFPFSLIFSVFSRVLGSFISIE